MASKSGPALDPGERDRLAALRAAESLADLVSLTGEDSEHDAYFASKREWRALRGRELAREDTLDALPGTRVDVDGTGFFVHGVTHADTDAEAEFLREHVSRFLDAGATVYAEQGVRSMYFEGLDGVCEMDDYRWAMRECATLDRGETADPAFAGITEEVDALTARFRDAAFTLIEFGSDIYGDDVEAALGDVASQLLTTHEDAATGEDFASFSMSREAAEDPSKLRALQHYYERAFLPQPVEREWLRRHDPELEVLTHARNERMADYAVYHHGNADAVHLVVGAAHQPGVRYYLERHRDGDRSADGFEPVG